MDYFRLLLTDHISKNIHGYDFSVHTDFVESGRTKQIIVGGKSDNFITEEDFYSENFEGIVIV